MRKLTISVAAVSALAIATGFGRTFSAPTASAMQLVREVQPGDDRGGLGHGRGADDTFVILPTPAPTPEAGDDRGGKGEVEPGDDKGGSAVEPGDDKGGGSAAEPGDDKGGSTTEAGDDKGKHHDD
jgi:hypothetical protein